MNCVADVLQTSRPVGATVPPLGLSNKAISEGEDLLALKMLDA